MDEDELLWMESGGRFFNVAPAKLEAFRAANPQSRRAHRFETEDGRGYNVSDEKLEAFRSANPGAVELRRVRGTDGRAAWRRPDPATPAQEPAAPAPAPVSRIDENGLLAGEADRMRQILADRAAARQPDLAAGLPTFQDITGISPEQASAILRRAQEAPPTIEAMPYDPGSVEHWDGRSHGVIGGTALGGFAQGVRDTIRSFDATALRLGADVADIGGNLVGAGGDNAVARTLRRGAEMIEGEAPDTSLASPQFRVGQQAGAAAGTVGQFMLAGALGGPAGATALMGAESEVEGIERGRAAGRPTWQAALEAAPGAAASTAAWSVVPGAVARPVARALGPGAAEAASMAAASLGAKEAQTLAERAVETARAGGAAPDFQTGDSLAPLQGLSPEVWKARGLEAFGAALTALGARGARVAGRAASVGLEEAGRRAIERRGGEGAGPKGDFANAGTGPRSAPADAGALPLLEVSGDDAIARGVRTVRALPGEQVLPRPVVDATDFRPALPDGTPLVRSQAEAAERARAELDALPPAERARRSSVEAFTAQNPGTYPLLELLGEKPFLPRPDAATNADAIGRLDPKVAATIVDARSGREGGWDVKAKEIADITGRDEYRGADGVERLVSDILEERAALDKWRGEGARDLERQASDAAEVAEAERLIGEERGRRQAEADAKRADAIRDWDAPAEVAGETREGLAARDEHEVRRDKERTAERERAARDSETFDFAEALPDEERARIGQEALAEVAREAGGEVAADDPRVQSRTLEKISALLDERAAAGKTSRRAELADEGKLRGDPAAEPDEAVRTGLDELYAKNYEMRGALHDTVNAAASAVGGTAKMRSEMKGRPRAYDKTVRENGGRVDDLKDGIGGTVILAPADVEPDFVALHAGCDAVAAKLPPGAKILRIKDFQHPAGYRDDKVNVEFANGARGEIIVLSDFMAKAKEQGHAAYEIERILPDSAESAELKADLQMLQKALYNRERMEAPDADSVIDALRERASSSLKNFLGDEKNFTNSSLDRSKLEELSPGLNAIKRPDVSSRSTTRPNPSENMNGMATSPSAGATTAPAGENLPKAPVPVNPPRASDAGASPAAPAAPQGTLFERAPSAPDVAKVDPATETAADPVRQELLDHLRAHPVGSELTVEQQAGLGALAARAEAAGLYRTAAEARQAAGTWTGAPFGAGGAWPMEAPPSVANSFGDLVTVVRQLAPGGLYPKIAKRLYRDAAGAFDAKDGQITLTSGLFAAVDPLQRARLRTEAGAEAAKTGRDAAELYREKLAAAMEQNLARGPRQAMATFAHEIGHLIDYLPEGTLARGNVFGHLAGLKKHLASTLYPDPATAEAYGGSPGLDPKQRAQIRALGEKNVKRYPGETPEEFRRRQSDAADRALRAEIARRGLAGKGEIVAEMQDLAKWFRGEDALDAHFAENPAELFAEAFSAWVNYPKTAAKKAPLFDALFQGWLEKRPDAARAIRAYQDGLTQREAAAAAHAGPGGTPDLTQSAFFAYKAEQDASARWAEQHLGELQALDTIGKWERTRAEAANWLVGPNEIWEKEMFARGGFSNPANLPLFRALQQRDNTGNMAAIWKYRYDTQVKPLLEGVPQDTFLNFLEYSRVAHERLGEEMEGGRANLPNPGGVTPGAVGRADNAHTSAAAWLQALQQHHPEIYAKCEAARKALWQEVRNGASMGGEGSPMQIVRESRALSQAQKDAIAGNEWYVAFRAVLAPDPTRPVSSDAISTWDGIFSQKDGGTLHSVGDVVANTLVQDYTLAQQLRALDARIEAVDWLRANKPEWIGERVAPAWDPATRRLGVPQLQKPGWRVLPLLRDGKAEGWWVPDFVAESLAPNRRGSVWGERSAASYARLQNASLTTQNVRFNIMNTLRDLDGAAFHAMPRSVRGVGVVQGAVNALWNVVGDLPLAARMLTDNTAALLKGGKWDPKVVHALASGALNNTAQGGSAYAANGGGGVYGMAADLREQGLTSIPKDKLRGFLGGMGFDPDRIDAALGREEGVMKKLGATWDWTWGNTAGKLNDWLSRGEIRVKSAALADLERRFPGMPPEQRAWFVRNMMGTPDMGNRPLADRNPYFRIVAPFYTPFVHGVRQQLAGVFRKDLGMRTTAAARLATRVAIKALSFVAPALAQTWATDAAEEAERERAAADAARAAGDDAGAAAHDAAAAAARERADRNFALAQRWEAIPTVHKVNGIVLPVGEKLGADSYIYLPSDPSTLGPETLILGMLGASLTPRQFDRRAVAGSALGEFTPNFGTGANTAIGLATGFDVNQGRQIVSDTDAHPELSMAGWIYDNITGRGRGIFPSSAIRRWIAGDEPFGSDSRRAASGIPGFDTFARTFLRRSGGGLQERRSWLSTGDKRRDADRKRTDEAFAAAILERNAAETPDAQAAAQKRIEDLGAQLAQYGGEPGERVRNLLQRVALRDGQGWTPAQLWALAQRWNISKRDVLRYGDTALRRQLFGDAHADGRGIDLGE